MPNFLGNLNVFDYKIHEWEVFYGKLTQFLKLNDISSVNQGAVLLTHLSDESYRLLRNLVHPKKLEDIVYSELVNILEKHFTPKRSTFADRAKFYEAIRSEGESIEEWAARLRGLAVHCDFGSELDTLLRDRFVLGFKTGHERDKLFECDSKTLTLGQALEVAQKAACARQARSEGAGISAGGVVVKEEPVYYAREGPSSGRAPPPPYRAGGAGAPRDTDRVERCAVCGLKSHNASKCRYKNYKCQNCGQKGHLKKLCTAKKSFINNITEEREAQEDCSECELYNLRWRGRLINIHPSLLPRHPGLNAQKQCLDAGDKESGCTVHFVDEGMDTGPIILQERVPVLANDTVESLSQRIHHAEHRAYPRALRLLATGRIRLTGQGTIMWQS